MTVYEAIAAMTAELAKVGIAKSRANEQQHYKFRGIDEVYAALAPLLPKHGLVILPRVLARDCQERQTKTGGVMRYVVLDVEFDFVSTTDGTKHTIRTIGEAMDSADKASNKAMSAAYKYACLLCFTIPTVGLNEDADSKTPEEQKPQQPKGYEAWLDMLTATADLGIDELKEAWKQSAEPLRLYLTSHGAETLAKLKATAAAVKVGA